jgi:glucosamine--fructose-6-phosphate aminotransferase (isomerizing)
MCGIVGYIGKRNAVTVLLNGLQRLEYRGYDSAGLSIIEDGNLLTFKKQGKVKELIKVLEGKEFKANIGIAHTRWATHGEPSDINAHPHHDNSGNIAIVHNGIIENYASLKQMLISKGYKFVSATDTEVLAVLIGYFYEKVKDLEEAVRTALTEVQGTFGLAVLSTYEPNKIIAARRGSPMIVGLGEEEFIVASDASAIIQYTRQVIYLSDNEMVTLNNENYYTKTIDNIRTNNIVHLVDFDLSKIEKGGFEHFMLKEIFEQPQTIRDACRGRLIVEEGIARLGGLLPVLDKLREVDRIIITGCGTSWHAGLVGEYLIENLCEIPVEVEYASEFRYRNPILRKNDIVIAIARQTDAGVYIHAGPEIGVASTKAFTSQLVVLTLISLLLGRMRNLSKIEGIQIARGIKELPEKVEKILEKADQIKEIAREFKYSRNFLYLGRGYNFPVALEGALKLKEISYIHAEGYPSAEMKHGPIALIDENMPVVFIAPKDEIYDKVISNIEEVRSRKGRVIAIATENDETITRYAERVIYIPDTLPMLTPILTVIPLQLLAYYIAVELGCNVDQPRNLAKSVTVE